MKMLVYEISSGQLAKNIYSQACLGYILKYQLNLDQARS